MPLSASQVQQMIYKGQAPKAIKRADKGKMPNEKDHIHFADDSALNNDGTWRHKSKKLTKTEKFFVITINWTLPK